SSAVHRPNRETSGEPQTDSGTRSATISGGPRSTEFQPCSCLPDACVGEFPTVNYIGAHGQPPCAGKRDNRVKSLAIMRWIGSAIRLWIALAIRQRKDGG